MLEFQPEFPGSPLSESPVWSIPFPALFAFHSERNASTALSKGPLQKSELRL